MGQALFITIFLNTLLVFLGIALNACCSEHLGKKAIGCVVFGILAVIILQLYNDASNVYKAGIINTLNNEVVYDTVAISPNGKILDIDFYKK